LKQNLVDRRVKQNRYVTSDLKSRFAISLSLLLHGGAPPFFSEYRPTLGSVFSQSMTCEEPGNAEPDRAMFPPGHRPGAAAPGIVIFHSSRVIEILASIYNQHGSRQKYAAEKWERDCFPSKSVISMPPLRFVVRTATKDC
jgi:hypothetical protein